MTNNLLKEIFCKTLRRRHSHRPIWVRFAAQSSQDLNLIYVVLHSKGTKMSEAEGLSASGHTFK